MKVISLKLLLKLAAILLIALGLKYHYSTASVDELRWILSPTTFLVEMITGIRFSFESHSGYLSADNTFLIAVSCSGVNFLIIAFLLLTLVPLLRGRDTNGASLAGALGVAYAMTLVANTTRIVAALALQRMKFSIAGIGAEEVHRIEGIVVYFLFLLLLFFAAERRWAGRLLSSSAIRSGLIYLLAIYYAVTLGIPLVRRSYLDEPSFWEHSIYVLLVPIVIVLPFALLNLRRKWNPSDSCLMSPTATNIEA